MPIQYTSRFPVDDVVLSDLHARAFGNGVGRVTPWAARLTRHALTWVGAFDAGRLVGFVQVCSEAAVRPPGSRSPAGSSA